MAASCSHRTNSNSVRWNNELENVVRHERLAIFKSHPFKYDGRDKKTTKGLPRSCALASAVFKYCRYFLSLQTREGMYDGPVKPRECLWDVLALCKFIEATCAAALGGPFQWPSSGTIVAVPQSEA